MNFEINFKKIIVMIMNKNNSNKNISYLFGPVPSRRLGISLGIDLVPYKTCSMDCIYCESGCTTDLTMQRKEYFPTKDIIKELDAYLSQKPELDYITFSGAGEPTLHIGIGEIISFIKKNYPQYKVCLLTNGMLLQDEMTFEDIKCVDLIVPSLDAPNADIFNMINRPAEKIEYDALIESFSRFHKESDAYFILEIFIVPDMNDSNESIKQFSEVINRINPDKVQLNSLDRPGAETWVPKVTEERMANIKELLSVSAEVEIIGKFIPSEIINKEHKKDEYQNLDQKILDLISRRPCTKEDMQASLGFTENTICKIIKRMLKKGIIDSSISERGEFYILSK